MWAGYGFNKLLVSGDLVSTSMYALFQGWLVMKPVEFLRHYPKAYNLKALNVAVNLKLR